MKKKKNIPHNVSYISNFPPAPNTWWMETSILPKVPTTYDMRNIQTNHNLPTHKKKLH